MMDEIIADPTSGFETTASFAVSENILFYWTMVLAAKANLHKYEGTFLKICTAPPVSRTEGNLRTDLARDETTINTNIRSALLAFTDASGRLMYRSENLTLGGSSGHFFQ